MASSSPAIIGLNVSDRDYFREIAGGRESVITNLQQPQIGEVPLFTVARGIRDGRGSLEGVVWARVNPAKFGYVALPAALGNGKEFSIIDRNGYLVYRYPEANCKRRLSSRPLAGIKVGHLRPMPRVPMSWSPRWCAL